MVRDGKSESAITSTIIKNSEVAKLKIFSLLFCYFIKMVTPFVKFKHLPGSDLRTAKSVADSEVTFCSGSIRKLQ